MTAYKKDHLTRGYRVWVDDNYHFGDDNERYCLGDFETYEEALQAARKIVEESFKKESVGKPAVEILKGYRGFGEDSWITRFGGAPEPTTHFSARTYAEEVSEKVAQGTFIPKN